jgi:hypothetical protein
MTSLACTYPRLLSRTSARHCTRTSRRSAFVCLCLPLSAFVCLCLFLSVSVCLCPILSIPVCSCLPATIPHLGTALYPHQQAANTVVTLLLHCCYTVVTLSLHCCYAAVTLSARHCTRTNMWSTSSSSEALQIS